MKSAPFSKRLLQWFDTHGRHDLPWQHPREPYRVWLAEIMLQQTQVSTVIPYFERFLQRFPTIATLAAAPIDDVLALWSGLGYYARARNLHRCAQQIVIEHGGEFPRELAAMQALPGIGRSTAGAILSQAYGQREAILDGNVRRVLARHEAIAGWPGAPKVQAALWAAAEARLPTARMADYTQALMDLGATLCTARRPACERCPVRIDCVASNSDEVSLYPGAKPRKARPRREARLLLLQSAIDGRLLLQRRPPVGIWGGLWSPPVLDDAEIDPQHWCERQALSPAAQHSSLPVVQHAFTHFDLSLQPLRLQVTVQASAVREPEGWRWVTITEAEALGLPAPIRKLLQFHKAILES